MIETARLRLRPWTEAELPALIGWNADPAAYDKTLAGFIAAHTD